MRLSADDPRVLQLGLGAYALRYQSFGMAVLGLGFASKRPHPEFRHGVDWATTDPAVVPWLWSRSKMAGIGIATGPASRLVVVDLDLGRGEDGPGSFGEFLVTSPGIPVDVVTSTPSGGYHIWMRSPPGWPVPTRLGLLPGVDIKGSGGYIVAPPTQIMTDSTEGQVRLPYRFAAGCPCSVPPAPAWFLEWISTAVGTGRAATSTGTGEAIELEQLVTEGLPVGARNSTLHRLACSLFRRYGATPAGMGAVRDAIRPVLAATDMRGFGTAEIERTLLGAMRFVARSEAAEADAWRSR